jgi:hypothetical protein
MPSFMEMDFKGRKKTPKKVRIFFRWLNMDIKNVTLISKMYIYLKGKMLLEETVLGTRSKLYGCILSLRQVYTFDISLKIQSFFLFT